MYSRRGRTGSNPEITSSLTEDDLIERLRAMTIPEVSDLQQKNDSFIFDDMSQSGDQTDGTSSLKNDKPTRLLCDRPSIQSPDFEELEASAGTVHKNILHLRKDLDNLRKVHQDFSRSFKADMQKKLLEFRKKASRLDEHLQNKLDNNNNHFFANELPVREQRFKLTSDQTHYRTLLADSEKQLSELEIHIELIRLNVVQTKRIEHPSQIEDFRDELTDVVKSISIAKKKYHGLEETLKQVIHAELEVIQREEQFRKEEPKRIENMIKRCRKISSTVETLQKLTQIQNDDQHFRKRKDTLV